jgi:hypothetical protein
VAEQDKEGSEPRDDSSTDKKADTEGAIIIQHPVAGTVKAILDAAPLYEDLIQPATKSLGRELRPAGKQIGGTVAGTVNLVLAPLRAVIWGWDKIEEIVVPEIGKRFEKALDRLVTPKPNVAGPIIEGLRARFVYTDTSDPGHLELSVRYPP